MALLVEELALAHGKDFIDRVGELQATVLDVNRGARMRQIAPIDIGDPPAGIFPRGHGSGSAKNLSWPGLAGPPSGRASARPMSNSIAWVARCGGPLH